MFYPFTSANKLRMFAFELQMNKQKTYFIFILTVLLSVSCSKYQKALKDPDANKKFELAKYYYDKKDYYRASTLLDQLQDNFSGTTNAEKVLFYSAYCNYGLKNYGLAGYQFKAYFENYPTGEWAEESLYMNAYCQFLESQPSYLDQTDTFKGIEAINLFVNVYPDSKYIPECNTMIDKLRAKLSMKAYRLAKLYFNIREYKSAIVALENTLKDYPEIAQKEELEYLTVKSNFLLAQNSIDEKKEERYLNTLSAANDFNMEYQESKYQKEVLSMADKANSEIKKIQSRKQKS